MCRIFLENSGRKVWNKTVSLNIQLWWPFTDTQLTLYVQYKYSVQLQYSAQCLERNKEYIIACTIMSLQCFIFLILTNMLMTRIYIFSPKSVLVKGKKICQNSNWKKPHSLQCLVIYFYNHSEPETLSSGDLGHMFIIIYELCGFTYMM